MNDEHEMNGTAQFAPQADDTIQELLRKARGMLEHLRVSVVDQQLFPPDMRDERQKMWESLLALLVRAREDPLLEDDARLEAQRVWAEELQISAMFILTMCVHTRTEQARKRFADNPKALEEMIKQMEQGRPAALRVLSTEMLDELRANGYLRDGE